MKDLLATVFFSVGVFILTGLLDHHFYPRVGVPMTRDTLFLDSLIDSLHAEPDSVKLQGSAGLPAWR